MTIKQFAAVYIPKQEGHSEDLTFLNQLIAAIHSYNENPAYDMIELVEYREFIKTHPNYD